MALFAPCNTLPVGPAAIDTMSLTDHSMQLRYESFTPNHVRVPRNQENFSEPLQLGIHVLAFVFLQSLPQNYPTVLAFEVLLAIYVRKWPLIDLNLTKSCSHRSSGPVYKWSFDTRVVQHCSVRFIWRIASLASGMSRNFPQH